MNYLLFNVAKAIELKEAVMVVNRPEWAEQTMLLKNYYDNEWGFEEHDDQKLFEILCMQSYQIGLNRQVVLNKREGFRHYFSDYQIDKVARMTATHIELMLINPAIIRNKLKLEATINNAQIIMEMKANGLTFNNYLWNFVDYKTSKILVNKNEQLPSKTRRSMIIANQMHQDGFRLVGPVTIYSFMLAIGMVDARV